MKRKLARIGVNAFLKMCFNDNFVHGDLHPGNILVSEGRGREPLKLIFLDAGITTVRVPASNLSTFFFVCHMDASIIPARISVLLTPSHCLLLALMCVSQYS